MKMVIEEIEITVQLRYRVLRDHPEQPVDPAETVNVMRDVTGALNSPLLIGGNIFLRDSNVRSDVIRNWVAEENK